VSALKDWLEDHGACEDGAKWALATGCESIEEVWLRDDLKPEWRIWVATRKSMVSDRVLRKFACACVRQVWHLLTDERSRNAVEVAERFADGNATKEELKQAKHAAWAAACAAASDAASNTASDAAWAAASDAASNTASDAACAAASDAAREAQAKILLELQPRLEVQP
jgi:hypothetical protein